MFPRFLTITVTACAFACSSCGNKSGLYPVSGKLTVNGEPAVGATVTFVRKEPADPFKEEFPQGVVGANGVFRLSGPAGEGAAPGEYVVLVEWKEGAGVQQGRSPGLNAPDRLQKKYMDPNYPMLTAKVEAKKNALPPFELKP
jgi:hypothetical protein